MSTAAIPVQMLPSESFGGVSARRSNRQLLALVVFFSLGASLVLEIWRPYFYLTDDNFSGYLPAVVEFSRKLWSGQWPFVNDHVFGGGYQLLRDPSGLGLFSPWLILFSWVALTPMYYALPDIVSICNSLTIACAFCWSALWLRRHFQLSTPDWLIVAVSLSYTFTPYNMIVGSSWIGFLNCQASFPLIVVGFFHPSKIRAVLLQTAALIYSLLGGHAHTFLVLCVFSGLLSLIVSFLSRDARPSLRLICAAVLFFVVLLPLLLPTFAGFQESPRANGVSAQEASISRIPLLPLIISYLLGPATTALGIEGLPAHRADPGFNLSLAFSLANLVFLCSLFFVRRLSALSIALLVCFLAAALMVIRPPWLAIGLSHVPLLRSLQWPFRELWLMHFTAHLFLVLNYRTPPRVLLASVCAASLLVFSGIFFYRSPTFYLFDLDRKLVISGEAERYWSQLLRENGTPPRVIVGMDPRFFYYFRNEVPFTLLGTYTFGSLWGFVSESGYTFTTAPTQQKHPDWPRPYTFPGAYTTKDVMTIWQKDPSVWRIDLLRVRPVEWSISHATLQRRFRLVPETNEVVELRDSVTTLPSEQTPSSSSSSTP
jgi:hypothetical protein